MKRPLLSICIPTYNRAEVLDDSLGKLFSDPDFDSEKIEVVVCDNCSPDNTPQILAKYPQVRYFRNEENIGDRNFQTVLSHGTGEYLKLLNDTASFFPGMLADMVEKIEQYRGENVNLFFCDNTFFTQDCEMHINTREELLGALSSQSPWIGHVGMWRQDFDRIEDKDKYADINLQQVDWNFQIVANGRPSVLLFKGRIKIAETAKKGGYNFFKVFLTNYFYILRQNKISIRAYEREKYRVYQKLVGPWAKKILYNKNKSELHQYDTSGSLRTIFSHYWYEPYFYHRFVKMLYKIYIK